VRAQVENLEKDRIGPLAELLEVYGFWKKKWAPWCEMLQFHRFVRDSGDLFSSRESEGALIIVPEPYLSQHDGTESAVRGYNILMDVLQRGRTLSGKDSIIAKMWDSRRKGLFHRVH
jgi:hypothetical protein